MEDSSTDCDSCLIRGTQMISSTSNPSIKHVRRLLADRRYRDRQLAFVTEGNRWLSELAQVRLQPHLILITEDWAESVNNQALLQTLATPARLVSNQVMAHASDTQTPSGVLAVVPMVDQPLPERLTLLLILDRVRDPGNLGTMLRTAAGAGVDGVLLTPGCVDVYNPKVVRAGMGAQLRLPLLSADWKEIGRRVAGLLVSVASAHGTVNYWEVDWCKSSALIVGSEATGASKEAESLATQRVSIPMYGSTESLNVAVATGIILFEAARQRKESKPFAAT